MEQDAADNPIACYERHPVEDIEPIEPPDMERLAKMLRVLMLWLTREDGKPRIFDKCGRLLAVRAAALIYAVRPDLVPPAPQMARKLRMSRVAFMMHVSRFRKSFPMKHRRGAVLN